MDDEDDEPPYHTRILDRQTKKVIADDGPYESENEAVDRAEAYLAWAKTKDMSIVAQVYQPEYGKNYVTWQVPDGGDYTVKEQGVAEGLDDPWGDQGNFAGDKPVNIGGDTVKQLQVGDIVTYFGQKAKIEAMSKTGNTSRITIANKMGGTTQDVLTRDLKRTGVAEEIGRAGGGFGTNYPGTYEQENGPFTHKGGLKLTSFTTESVDYLDEK